MVMHQDSPDRLVKGMATGLATVPRRSLSTRGVSLGRAVAVQAVMKAAGRGSGHLAIRSPPSRYRQYRCCTPLLGRRRRSRRPQRSCTYWYNSIMHAADASQKRFAEKEGAMLLERAASWAPTMKKYFGEGLRAAALEDAPPAALHTIT